MPAQSSVPRDYVTIGKRIRERRLQFGWSTQKLADTAGVARYTIVRMEQGYPAHEATLIKVRKAMRLWTDQMERPFPQNENFVTHRSEETSWTISLSKQRYQKQILEEDPFHVNDPAERQRLGQLGFQPFFTSILRSNLPFGQMEQALMEIHQPSWVDSHYGEEFVYCLRGEVTLIVNEEPCELRVGDAICFDAKLPHQYLPTHPIGPDQLPALILIVVTKPPKKRKSAPKSVTFTSQQ